MSLERYDLLIPACFAACPRVIFMECPSVYGSGQPETGKRIPHYL
jgi:hypothetical protein